MSNYLQRVAEQIRVCIDPDVLPDEDVESLLLDYAVLALAKGRNVTAEDVHNAWTAWMTGVDPTHESLRPYSELSREDRLQDVPFTSAIREVARRISVAD